MALLILGAFVLVGKAAPLPDPIVLTQVPRNALRLPPSWDPRGLLRANWFDGARIILVSPQGSIRVLSAGFHSAADPDVSWDGRRVVFAGRKAAETPWGIWEIGVDGSGLRPITHEEDDCRSPVYLGSLFTLDSPEPWFTVLFAGTERTRSESGFGYGTSLYSVKMDGTELRRLTFNPSASFDAVPMWDGRVLYSTWRSTRFSGAALVAPERDALAEAPSSSRVSLFGIHIDGMDHELFGAEQGRSIQHMACVTETGRVLFIEMDTATWDGAGQIAGIREQRPHHSYERITNDPQWAWLHPSPLARDTILITRRRATEPFDSGVYQFDLVSGRAGVVFDQPEFHDVQAKVVRARQVPDGRSTVVETKYPTGRLFGLNAYLADAKLQPRLLPGSIARLRVLEGVPAGAPSAGIEPREIEAVGRRLLGEAPVDPDGSFHIEIPADLPIVLQAVDSNGLALATCGWLWVKQNENRGCIGCHEDPELIPENHFAPALGRKSHKLTLPPDQRRAVGFREHVWPLLAARCAAADCHGGADTPLRFPSAANPSDGAAARLAYTALMSGNIQKGGSYLDPGQARASFLIWQILGRNASRPGDRDANRGPSDRQVRKMPPADAPPLTENEIRLLIEWIDLGAPWETPQAQ